MESLSVSTNVLLYMLVVNDTKRTLSFLLVEVVVQEETKCGLDCFRRVCIINQLTKTHPVYPLQFFSYVLEELRFIRVGKDEERRDLQQFLSVSKGLEATESLIKNLMLL